MTSQVATLQHQALSGSKPDVLEEKDLERGSALGQDLHSSPEPSKDTTVTNDLSAALRPMEGWRLAAIMFTMLYGLFLATVETSITATALVTIGEHFNDFVGTTWVVISYLLSYMGFSVIFARVSDGLGRKNCILAAWVIFGGFSLASGLASSLNQLIAFRAIQGIGGSGLFSMTMIVLPQISPARLWGLMSGLIGVAFACASVVGPLLGGVITQNSTWRWVYLFNAPATAVGIAILLVSWPKSSEIASKDRRRSLVQMDVPGALLLLIASTLIVFAIQEAGSSRYDWNSPTIIATLVVSSVCWVVLVCWIVFLDSKYSRLDMKPIFPISVAMSIPTGPAILIALLTGFPLFIAIINLPQRFQIVNGDTPIMAGVHLLPLLSATAFGSGLGGAISSKKNFTSYSVIAAGALMLIGSGLLSTLSTSREIEGKQYAYQFIMGIGIGITMSSITLMTAVANTYENVAAAQGAVVQARVLGGSIGLAVATIIFNAAVKSDLSDILTPSQLQAIQQSLTTIGTLTESQQAAVANVFAESFNQQMRVCTYISAATFVAALLTWQKNPPSVAAAAAQNKVGAGEV